MGLFSFTQEIAMDLGTANTIIITNGKIVVNKMPAEFAPLV
jgi:rod shape-determining protein MreB